MLSKKKKQTLIKKSAGHPSDTGSSSVQVAILDERIKQLSDHLKTNRKDNHSRRGLLGLVAKRRTHLREIAKREARMKRVASK